MTRLVGLVVAVLLLGATTAGEPVGSVRDPGHRVPDPGIAPTVGPVPFPRWQIVVEREL